LDRAHGTRSSGATAGAVGTRGSADGGDAVCCALGTGPTRLEDFLKWHALDYD
jgi:hypothetical protein